MLGYEDGFFPLPEPLISGPATRVMSLKDGARKMSKSDPSDLSRINLTDDADTIAKKFRRAKTDPHPLPSDVEELKSRPEAANLLGIYAALARRYRRQHRLREFAGQQFSSFKQSLVDLAVATLGPIARGNEAAAWRIRPLSMRFWSTVPSAPRRLATPVLAEVKKILGFVRR